MTGKAIRLVVELFLTTLLSVAFACVPLLHSPSNLNDCFDIRRLNATTISGFYDVTLPGCSIFVGSNCIRRVYCDMTTEGGGWTVIQQRQTGVVNFFASWNEYKLGFGNDTEFWIGNDYMYAVTNLLPRTYEMVVQGDDGSGNRLISRYSDFRVGAENTSYLLSYSSYTGNYTIDNLSASRSQRFGTYDQDTDNLATVTCGSYWRSGWWFEPTCLATGNLNIPYEPSVSGPQLQGIRWVTPDGNIRLFRTQMRIRPTSVTTFQWRLH